MADFGKTGVHPIDLACFNKDEKSSDLKAPQNEQPFNLTYMSADESGLGGYTAKWSGAQYSALGQSLSLRTALAPRSE